MASTNYAIRANAPTSTGTNVTVGSASSTAGSVNFGTVGSASSPHAARIWMKSDVKTHIRFGSSSVAGATTTDIYLTADQDYVFDVTPDVTSAVCKRGGSTNGILRWAKVA